MFITLIWIQESVSRQNRQNPSLHGTSIPEEEREQIEKQRCIIEYLLRAKQNTKCFILMIDIDLSSHSIVLDTDLKNDTVHG